MNDFFKNHKRLNAREEQDLGRQILAAEDRAREAIRGIPCGEEILGATPKRAERTRAGRVDRLELAIETVWRASTTDAETRRQARAGKQAWAEIEALRWRLAMSAIPVAHGEARKLAGAYLDEPDLVQEGYIGLLRAAKRFDPDRGIRFATYARWWARAQMTRAIDLTGRPVRLPGCAVEQTRNLRKAMKMFEAEGVEYSLCDLAGEIGIDEDRAKLLLSQGGTISLDAPLDEGPRTRTLEQVMCDDDAASPDEEVVHGQEVARLMEGFARVLDERQRYVLAQRYGLEDGEFRILADVGRKMGLSRERVRQIERKALDLLREHARIREGLPAPAEVAQEDAA